MKRIWVTWLLFFLCVAVLFSAMGWISLTALRLERAEAEARRHAELEQRTRLALWRMDSAISTLIAQESGRQYFTYSAFYPIRRAYTRMFQKIRGGEVITPSPLLTYHSPFIRIHFQFDPSGSLTSPQVPIGNMRDLAESGYTPRESIEAAISKLTEFSKITNRDKLLSALKGNSSAQNIGRLPISEEGKDLYARQKLMASNSIQAFNAHSFPEQTKGNQPTNTPSEDVEESNLEALWMGSELILARRVVVVRETYVQGCWLDWGVIRQSLLNDIKDIFPQAALQPATPSQKEELKPTLAALPIKLIPGRVSTASETRISPIFLSLTIAWLCVLLAATATAMLLHGAIVLSERRGSFVSAVTHELRTPLTTFRMYAEMLSEKMVPDKQKQMRYLNTLRTEADRLGHLVENVLAYARLESGRARSRLETLRLAELLDRVTDRLSSRAEQSGMELIVEMREGDGDMVVRADISAVEQILFNLVDNACKYAATAADRRIHLQGAREAGVFVLRIRDHGPGIPREGAKRLFRPFSKSARDAANSMPGVGLGLALSRRLALEMHGDLALNEDVAPGACFELALPAD